MLTTGSRRGDGLVSPFWGMNYYNCVCVSITIISDITDSPSGLLWCLSVDGSVHHCREKWATSAVHWPSRTLPPPNSTRSSWTTWRKNWIILQPYVFFCLMFDFISTFCSQGAWKKQSWHMIYSPYRHTPPAAHCPPSVRIVQLGNQLSHGSQRSLFGFLRLLWYHQLDWLFHALVRWGDLKTGSCGGSWKYIR